MPVWEHLDELRNRLIHCLLVFVLAVFLTYQFSEPIVKFLELPLLKILPPDNAHLYFTGITDKFMVYLEVSILAAITLISPYLLFQIWRFISPGLYDHERKFMLPLLGLGTFSFLAGMAFSYYVVIPNAYAFLIQFGSENDKAIITLKEYFSLTVKMLLALGLTFEFPCVILLLVKFQILSPDTLAKYRRHAIVVIAIIAAIITPSPDAFTLLMVMVPLYLLYELSYFLSRVVNKQ